MNTYYMKLNPSPYQRMKTGLKNIEVRVNDEKRQKLHVGDTITFSQLPELKEQLNRKITKINHYKTFRELITIEGLERFGHQDLYTINSWIESYYKIYSKENEEKYGVIAIYLKKP